MEWAAFILTVVFALLFHWQAKDLIWGLWISSFCVGYAFIVRTIVVGIAQRPKVVPFLAASIGGIFMLAFFTFHFGMFHFVHSIFLNLFFPLIPGARAADAPNVPLFAVTAFKAYWPIVLANLLVKLPDFQTVQFDLKNAGEFMSKPYRSVLKIHMLIFIFAGMSFLQIDRFAIYPILILFFFPVENLIAKKKEAGHESS